MSRMWNVALIVLLSIPTVVLADSPDFLRVLKDKKSGKPLLVQTATVTYEKGEGENKVNITAVAVVHVGDKAYYMNLNKKFEEFDSVCYEFVAPEGANPNQKDGFSPQDVMSQFLDLTSQLKEIDYGKSNFVHADMTPEQMQEAMAEKGDDMFNVVLFAIAESRRAQNLKIREMAKKGIQPPKPPEMDLLDVLNPVKLKQLMATSFDSDIDSALGPTAGSYLIDARNKKAMKVVDEQFENGKKNVALFYGAAHFKHFHGEFKKRGFKAESVQWENAWDMTKGHNSSDMETILRILQQMQK